MRKKASHGCRSKQTSGRKVKNSWWLPINSTAPMSGRVPSRKAAGKKKQENPVVVPETGRQRGTLILHHKEETHLLVRV
jgi:hypothetical protein